MKVKANKIISKFSGNLTIGKVYEVGKVDPNKQDRFWIKDDNGDIIRCRLKSCPHTNADWEIVE